MSDAGKVAIVTGSATGLGAAVAEDLAQKGVKVVVNYSKSASEAEETAERIRAAGGAVHVAKANVSEDADCRALVKAAENAFGRVDILVNNAGTTKFADHADLDALEAEDFLNLYKVNVIGAYQMTRAAAPLMRTAGMGAVVNVASIAGLTGIGSSIAYAASKGAMITMTKSLARSLAPEVRVNAVCPGFIGTRWFKDKLGDNGFKDMVAVIEEKLPLNQAGTPELVSDAVVFFCLDGARHITGETLLSDGGHLLNIYPR